MPRLEMKRRHVGIGEDGFVLQLGEPWEAGWLVVVGEKDDRPDAVEWGRRHQPTDAWPIAVPEARLKERVQRVIERPRVGGNPGIDVPALTVVDPLVVDLAGAEVGFTVL